MNKRSAGFLASILVIMVLYCVPLPVFSVPAQRCLALTVGAVILWVFEVIPSGMTALGLTLGYLLLVDPGNITVADVYKFWTMPMAYLVLGGFIIGAAVRESGLGRRISLLFISRFVHTYDHIIISCYVLSYLLAVLIPQALPRAFLLLSIMKMITEDTGLEKKYIAQISLAIFAAQSAAGMMFMTGEGSINTVILSLLPPEVPITWLRWLLWLSVPALFTGVARCFIQLRFFGRPDLKLDGAAARQALEAMGPLSKKEKRVLFWLVTAVVLWGTGDLHGINVGWVTVAVVFAMSLPLVGDVVNVNSFKDVSLNVMLFIMATTAIGAVGEKSGMSQALSTLLLPESIGGVLTFMLLAITSCMVLHLCVGGVMSVFVLITPATIHLADSIGLPPFVAVFTVYLITYGQWFFPYQNLSMALCISDSESAANSRLITKFSCIATIPAILSVFLAYGWWKILGLY